MVKKKSKMIVYEKPTCSTCRAVLGILKDKHVTFETINYYEKPFTASVLKKMISKLGFKPRELLRTKEPIYKKLRLGDKKFSYEEIIGFMIKYPDLMQRPIVVRGNKVILARPVEKINAVI